MKKFLTFFSLFLLLVFQTTAGQYIKVLGVLPNFMLTFIVIYSISNTCLRTVAFGAVCGFMMDMVAPHSPFGVSALLVMYISLGIYWIANQFYYDNVIPSMVFVFVATLVYETVYLIITKEMSGDISFFYCLWRYILPESVINALISIPLRIWVRWLKNEYIRGI